MSTLVQTQRERRAALKRDLDNLIAGAEARSNKNFTPAEAAQFDQKLSDLRSADARIVELEEVDDAEERAAGARRMAGEGGAQRSGWSVGREAGTYRPDGEHSFFKDMVASRHGDWSAAERLHRNAAEVGTEHRALGNTGATGGSFGEFAPPAWLLSDFVQLARAGRVTADRLHHEQLPSGVSTINIPKVTGGTSTAIQTTQNTTVATTDPTSSFLSSGIVTIAGKNVISQQLLDQSPVALDRIILGDLAADYARNLDRQVLSGTGSSGQLAGLLNVSGINTITYTQATPSVTGTGGFYAQINKAISAISTTRFLPPSCIVMHPQRWSWVAASFDSSGRPLVAPSGNAFNQIADAGSVAAQGAVGQMAGLPVYTDPNLPVNLGAGTNQDPVIVMRAEDLYLWESDVVAASFDAPYAESLGVLLRVHGYAAMIPNRYPSSIAVISGTGLVTPSY